MKIKPIDKIITTDGVHAARFEIYDPLQVRKLEADYQEAIDAIYNLMVGKHSLEEVNKIIKVLVSVLEKVYGMPWEEIVKEEAKE